MVSWDAPHIVPVVVTAVAFFVLPTRVHERYLYPFIAVGAILAAVSIRWRVAYVVLSVTDHGPGVPEALVPTLFSGLRTLGRRTRDRAASHGRGARLGIAPSAERDSLRLGRSWEVGGDCVRGRHRPRLGRRLGVDDGFRPDVTVRRLAGGVILDQTANFLYWEMDLAHAAQ